MKMLVKNVRLAMTPFGPIIRLEGDKCALDMASIAPAAFLGLASIVEEHDCEHCPEDACKNRRVKADGVMDYAALMKELTSKSKIDEVYINGTTLNCAFVAEIKINGETRQIVPSVGVLIAKAAGAPIYFDSTLAQNQQ
jgi:hypothetical protein